MKSKLIILFLSSCLAVFAQHADSTHIYYSSGKMYSDADHWAGKQVDSSNIYKSSWGYMTSCSTFWGRGDSCTTFFADSGFTKTLYTCTWHRGDTLQIDSATFYGNGQLKRSFSCKNMLRDGYYEEQYPDGALKIAGYYRQGKKEGTWKIISEKGPMMIDEYRNGDIVKSSTQTCR